MKAEVLSHFPMIWLSCLALLLFFSTFAGILFWVSQPKIKSIYNSAAKIPMDEDE